MSSETGTANRELPDAYYRRLFSLIPARSLKSVISELSAVWCEATGAEAAYLAVFDCGTQRLTAGIFSSAQNETECFIYESIEVSKNRPVKEQVQSVFEQGRPFQQISCGPFDYFPIPCDQFEIAGVYLFSSTRWTSELPLIAQLIHLSRCLLAQVTEQKSQTRSTEGRVFPSTEKLEAMAEFAAGAGHEINNPVATIAGRVQMLLKEETDPERRRSLTTIGGQAYRVRDMIGDAMLFARPPVPQPTSLNLRATTEEVLVSLKDAISDSGIQISVEISDAHAIWADEVQCKVVLSNLILNGLNVLEAGGHLRIVSEEVAAGSNFVLHIRVIDDGPGLTEQEREHLFDPFYSARQAGRGLGFGLSKCWRIISLHGGTIEAESNPDRGATFHLFWPRENPSKSTAN
tara:strand:- start:4223 stop:5434 length:1212 start_codon:yes stop_codon:yes gene_type:complete